MDFCWRFFLISSFRRSVENSVFIELRFPRKLDYANKKGTQFLKKKTKIFHTHFVYMMYFEVFHRERQFDVLLIELYGVLVQFDFYLALKGMVNPTALSTARSCFY